MCHNVTNAPKDNFLELRSEVKVTVTPRQYASLRDPKAQTHTKFGIPTSNNIGDMLWTWVRLELTDGRMDTWTESSKTICSQSRLKGHKNSDHLINMVIINYDNLWKAKGEFYTCLTE